MIITTGYLLFIVVIAKILGLIKIKVINISHELLSFKKLLENFCVIYKNQ